ncbi:MAG TPA: hypothetical protein VN926_01865 [Bradyrhizobium sp.]|nr:hypothetical protein [Bradyrhizobium sp.]
MSVAQFRDAAGYMKVTPQPARKVTQSGIVRMAGSTIAVNATGILDGKQIKGLAATDGLVNAGVATDGIGAGVTVKSVLVEALPGQTGTIELTNVAPFAPTTNVPQPIVFTILLRHSTISGLAATDGLAGAKVSGAGIPDGAIARDVNTPAVSATNVKPGTPGEVRLVVRPKPSAPAAAVAPGAPPVAPQPAPPPPAATLTPVDVTFDVPVEPIQILDGVSEVMIFPTEPLDAVTITLPPKPVDGQKCHISTSLALAAVTLLPSPGQKLNLSPAPPPPPAPAPGDPLPEAPTFAIAADSGVGYLYSLPDTTWNRIR